MERLNYTSAEIREALRYLREQCAHLAQSHAGNWRRKYTLFIEGVTKNQEALKLLGRLLDGHQAASGSAWYRAASDKHAPPMPADRYEKIALVYKLVCMAMQKSNPDGFDSREKVDLPYVLVNSDLPGGSLGEKYEEFRLRYIVPFCEEVDKVADHIERAIPKDASAIDFWDTALAALTAKSEPGAPHAPAAAPAPVPAPATAPSGAAAEALPDPTETPPTPDPTETPETPDPSETPTIVGLASKAAGTPAPSEKATGSPPPKKKAAKKKTPKSKDGKK